MSISISDTPSDFPKRLRQLLAIKMNGAVVVEYGIETKLRDASDGTWHGGVKESVAKEKVREMGKHVDDSDLSVAKEGGYGYLFFNVSSRFSLHRARWKMQ